MMKTNNKMILTAAMAGLVALSAPMAASAAQSGQHQPQAGAQSQQRPQTQPTQQQRPQTQPAPQQQQRPQTSQNAPSKQGSQQSGPSRPGQQQAHRTGSYRITTTVNVRESASTQSRRVGQVRAGRTVQVDRVSGNWLHIRNQGWISAQYARHI